MAEKNSGRFVLNSFLCNEQGVSLEIGLLNVYFKKLLYKSAVIKSRGYSTGEQSPLKVLYRNRSFSVSAFNYTDKITETNSCDNLMRCTYPRQEALEHSESATDYTKCE